MPTGIYYTAKHVFRSAALVMFGEPLRVQSTGEAIPEEVDRLTAAIDAGLDAVTVQADSHAALDLIARAEDIFTANDEQPLAEELELRRTVRRGLSLPPHARSRTAGEAAAGDRAVRGGAAQREAGSA